MSVPFIDLKRFEQGFLEDWNRKTVELSAKAGFIGGPEIASLEGKLREDCSVSHAISCANGTDALQLALRSLGIGPGDTVLLPDITFWATFEAVVNVGAKPCTVDINNADLQMDLALFKEAAEKTHARAAIIAHLYGWASGDLQAFRSYCREKDIALIEDGAQSYGVTIGGKSIYSEALISTISFYPAKVFGAAGDGGAVLMNDANLAEKVLSLGNHGREKHYAHGLCGWNSRMDSFQAAFLNLVQPHLANRLQSRRDLATRYRNRLKEIGIECVAAPSGIVENGYLNVTLQEPKIREKIIAVLKEKGIGFGTVYPGAVSEQKGAADYIGAQFGGANARSLSERVLNLPLFPYMTEPEFEEILTAVSSCVA